MAEGQEKSEIAKQIQGVVKLAPTYVPQLPIAKHKASMDVAFATSSTLGLKTALLPKVWTKKVFFQP